MLVLYGKYTMEGDQFEEKLRSILAGRRRITSLRVVVRSGQNRIVTRSILTHDIDLYCDLASGLVNIAIMDGTVWRLLNGFKLFREKLDTRRGSISGLETAVERSGRSGVLQGVLRRSGHCGGENVLYSEKDGIEKALRLPVWHAGSGEYCCRNGIRCYGAIQDAQALSEGVVASSRYPKHWLTVGDPAREFTMTQSAPLMVLPGPG